MLMGKAIVVTGTPGTGKTIFSKELAEEIGGIHLPLNKYVRNNKLCSEFDRKRQSYVVNLKKARSHVGRFLRSTSATTIVDSNIADIVTPRNLVRQVLVLRTHPKILETRLRRRGWLVRKVQENVLAEILGLCYADAVEYYGTRKVAQIDTSTASTRLLARRIRSGKKISSARIDWLVVPETQGLIEKYHK